MNFLPGWFPAVTVSADPGIVLTQELSATAETTVAVPNGVLAGDFIVIAAFGASQTTDTPNFTDPDGFTLLVSLDGSTDSRATRCRIFGKVAVGNEDGTNVTVFTDSDDARTAHCVVFRPSRAILNVAAVSTDSILSQFNPAAITVGTGLEYNLALTLFGGVNLSAVDISSRSSTPAQDGETGPQTASVGTIDAATAFRWHIWHPVQDAEAVMSDIGDTGVGSSMTSVAVLLS